MKWWCDVVAIATGGSMLQWHYAMILCSGMMQLPATGTVYDIIANNCLSLTKWLTTGEA